MDAAKDHSRIEAYESRTATFMVVLALVFLGLFATQVLWLSIPPGLAMAVLVGECAIYAAFIADFGYRVYLAPRRWLYVAKHPLDVLTLALPMLRPLRALRVFAAARVLIQRGHYVTYGRVVLAIVFAATFVILVGALVVLEFERFAPGTSITTFGQALWWGVVTITTVGYGDISPVTTGGRVAATAVMVVGIGLLGAVTASFAGWFTQRVRGDQEAATLELVHELAAIRAELEYLRAERQAEDAAPVPRDDGAATSRDTPLASR